jgi:hypothetical protein
MAKLPMLAWANPLAFSELVFAEHVVCPSIPSRTDYKRMRHVGSSVVES